MTNKTAAHAKFGDALKTNVVPSDRVAAPAKAPEPRRDPSPPPAVPQGK